MSLKERMQENNCDWLEEYLKNLLKSKDFKKYNRAKNLIYYFPQIVDGLSQSNFEFAISKSADTYICLGREDNRYKVFDDMYEEKNGKEFEPNTYEYYDNVPMIQTGQQVTYVVRGQDVEKFLDLQMSNEESYIIPGLDPSELVLLKDATHYSRFDAQRQRRHIQQQNIAHIAL